MSVNITSLREYNYHYDHKKLIDLVKGMNKKLGRYAPIIAVEELSELIQATSKWLRFEQPNQRDSRNKMSIIEEIADATIALHIIKDMAGVSQKDINQMIAYKIDRKLGFLNEGKMIRANKKDREGF